MVQCPYCGKEHPVEAIACSAAEVEAAIKEELR